MRVLVLNYEFPPVGGGGGVVCSELGRSLVQAGHDVDIVTMAFSDLPRFELFGGMRIYRTPAIRLRADICRTPEMATYLFGGLPTVLALVRRRCYDIIHCHFIIPTSPLAWLAGKAANVPYVVTCHGSDVPGHNPQRFKVAHELLKPSWRLLARSADLLISPSESLKMLIQANCPGVDVAVIPNGFEANRFSAAPKKKTIVMCSRILSFKGFQFAIEAMRSLRSEDWQVHIIGDGPYLDELKRLAANCALDITFWGWLDQADERFKELYETGSIFIFPSESENFPTVLLEAMSAGMAIITSDVGGCREVVGDTALFVPPRDSEAIGRQLSKLITDDSLRERLSRAARLRVEKFGWSNIANKYVDCCRRVINERHILK